MNIKKHKYKKVNMNMNKRLLLHMSNYNVFEIAYTK